MKPLINEPARISVFSRNLTSVLCAMFLLISCNCLKASERVKVKIAQYSSSLKFSMPSGGHWKSGNKTGRITKKNKCSITGRMTSPSIKNYHVIVDSVPLSDDRELKETIGRWKEQGFKVHTYPAGKKLYEADGKTLIHDGRTAFISTGRFISKPNAEALKDKLASDGTAAWIFEEVIKPAQGTLALTIDNKILTSGNNEIIIEGLKSSILKKVERAKGFSWHGFSDLTFSGPISISWGAHDAIDCVLATDLETLLAGVVPSEISSNAPAAAIQAQGTAARGEILSKLALRHINEGYDFCSEQHCQVYNGDTPVTGRIAEALAPTNGLILKTAKGTILDAVYSANCGGRTSPNHMVWTSRPDPHLQGVWDCPTKPESDLTDETDVAAYIANPPDAYCNHPKIEGSDKFRWSKTVDGKAWKAVEASAGLGKIKNIGDFRRDASGRLYSITLEGERGKKTILKELAIRRLFGMLRSSCFVVEWTIAKDGFIEAGHFRGAGWGHGVGMCQTGAQYLATQGWDFKSILAHYYPGCTLVKIY